MEQQQQQQFRNITYLSDRSGTGKWRNIWPIQSIDCISQGTGIQSDYSQTPILDANFYNGVTSVTVQRWISDQQKDIFQKFLKPLSERNRFFLVYEEDDDMLVQHIPLYNRGRKAFESPQIQDNIRYMLNNSDIVTVTTDYIRKIYHEYYDVPLEKIVAIPNLLPRYLFGDKYSTFNKLKQFEKSKKKNGKMRIGIVSSLSHYNIDNVRTDDNGLACRLQEKKQSDGTTASVWVNENNQEIPEENTHVILDDFDIVCDCIRETVDDFQWVMFGFCPPKIKDLVERGKIECHGGVPIMNYASHFYNLNLQAVVAPIIDMEFNRCKSFIKYMECAALGVPLFASNCTPYDRVMPKEQLFNDGKQLKEMLKSLKSCSSDNYKSMIEAQWKWLNSPCHEGDFDIRNFWLEDNLNIYVDKYRMRNKCAECSLQVYLDIKAKQQNQQKENTIFQNDNGVEILK